MEFRAWDNTRKEMFTTGNLFIDLVGDLYLDRLDYKPPHDRFVIMKDTGLKDKYGQRIYEGDIYSEKGERGKFRVFWSEEHACFAVEEHGGWDPFTQFGPILVKSEMSKIGVLLGNVHENPELLNDK